METKLCTTCRQVLPLTDFYRRKDGRSRGATCKRCEHARTTAWRQTEAGKASQLETNKRYRESDAGAVKRAAYRTSDANKEVQRRYRQTEKGQATTQRANASQDRKIRAQRYYESGKGKERIARYQATEKGRESLLRGVHKRRALIGTESTLTAAEWAEIKATHGNACAYCKRTDRPLTRDHVIPLAQGGQHVKENIVPACRPCNSRKNNRTPEQISGMFGS